MRSIILLGILALSGTFKCAQDEASMKARQALEFVERVRNRNCTGAEDEVLPVHFDHTVWQPHAEIAMRMSNLLTKSLSQHNNTLNDVTEQFLFDLVRNNVEGSSSLIVGSAIGLERDVFGKYSVFAPYAYRRGDIHGHDLSVNYDYFHPSSEWYNTLRVKNVSQIPLVTSWITYRNTSGHGTVRLLRQPVARLEDGHWTLPYFDCGGGDIWSRTCNCRGHCLRGVSTIDIELINIDINQCDVVDTESRQSVDVFRGTHHCQSSTQCVPVSGQGFIPGAYKCVCESGYYFPSTSPPPQEQFFNGTVLEAMFLSSDVNVTEVSLEAFHCLPCAEGCDTCVDDSPCLYSYRLVLRATLLVISISMILLIILTSVIVSLLRKKRVIKSASPLFLQIMCAGAVLMFIPLCVRFPEATGVTCVLELWLRHVGFSLAYGALLLKTWRIATIFQVKSARKINLSDKVLAQRFIPILAVPLMFLTVWCVVDRPLAVWRRTSGDLKFKDCDTGWWQHAAVIIEGVFLMWGAYLCFVVRKAPSHFNESKYITWAIYNNIIVGSFIIVAREFIAVSQGPDILYVFDFVYDAVCVFGLTCLIFLPKFYVIYRNRKNPDMELDESVTGPSKSGSDRPQVSNSQRVDVGVQVDPVQEVTEELVEEAGMAKPGRSASNIIRSSVKVHPA